MTFSISLSTPSETILMERAAAEGKEPTAFAAQLLEDAIGRLAPTPAFVPSLVPSLPSGNDEGMDDEELDRLL